MVNGTQFKGALVVILSATMAAPVIAQISTRASGGTPLSADERADALQDNAAALHGQPQRYAEAAWLYRESAALRPLADARAVEALTSAAHLYNYANRPLDARKVMEQAARRALARGDVVRASQANLDAAFFADKQGNRSQVNRLGRAALTLAGSPLLNAQQRASIVDRIKASPGLAALLDAAKPICATCAESP